MTLRRGLVAVAVTLALLGSSGVAVADTSHHSGTLPNGATWIADIPARWNGTILLYSHGYNPMPDNPPRNAPNAATAEALLQRGYALAGSSYSRSGWATGTAVQDQFDTLAAVKAITGRPRQVIAVGTSMGGLITGLIAERGGLDGALSTCGLMAGGIDLINYQLDGAHAISRLLEPAKLVRFAGAAEASETSRQMIATVDRAQATPEGRARVALAAVLSGKPAWAAGQPNPAPGDHDAEQLGRYRNLRETLSFTTPARYDIEQTSGGNPSWNVGVDYRALLRQSGGWDFVATLYRQAGADLEADLALLTRTADVKPDPQAQRWMNATSVPTGRLAMPMLTLHTTDDALVPVEHEEEYAEDVTAAGKAGLLRQAYTEQQGHCTFTPAELVAGVDTVKQRVETGRWGVSTLPNRLQERAESLDLGPAAFTRFRPAEFTGDRPKPAPVG